MTGRPARDRDEPSEWDQSSWLSLALEKSLFGGEVAARRVTLGATAHTLVRDVDGLSEEDMTG